MVPVARGILLGIFCLASVKTDDDNPVLTIEDGTIQGTSGRTVGKNKTYYAFRGIPYAEPPLGDLRFKPAERNLKWNGTLNATQDQSQCVQENPAVGSEDCLYINVYTPSLTTKNLTVMVWIYGGGFISGNSSYTLFAPDYLLEEDVVFVDFNYRLGIFGFISTEDTTCSGNFGLGDQILALQWVQRNIHYFGGDPEKVTVFGESAGSVSVSYLLQIPLAKGLFRAAIMESGSSECLWGLNRRARKTAFDIGAELGISTSDSGTLIEELRNVDYKRLQAASEKVSTANTVENALFGIMYSPVKEPFHEGALFYNNSQELFSEGHFNRVPTMIGFNSNEAAAVEKIPALLRLYLLKYDIEPPELVPASLTKDEEKIAAVAKEIRRYYFGILPIAVQTTSVVKYISDDQFNRPIRQQVIDTSRYASVYFYKFSYEGILGGRTDTKLPGVGHAEELGYIFNREPIDGASTVPEDDQVTRKRVLRMWTNFAKYLDPTPIEDPLLQNITWFRANSIVDHLTYLDINTNLKIGLDPFSEEMEFWDNIYNEYGDPPYNTY